MSMDYFRAIFLVLSSFCIPNPTFINIVIDLDSSNTQNKRNTLNVALKSPIEVFIRSLGHYKLLNVLLWYLLVLNRLF